MTNLFDITPYLDSLQRGDTFITANSRISDAMRSAYATHLREQPNSENLTETVIVESPTILSLNQWLANAWDQYQALEFENGMVICLSKLQRMQLWQSIIAKNLDAMPMAKPEHLSGQADSAYRSLLLWQIDQEQLASFSASATQYPFLIWFQQFNDTLQKNQWATAEQQQAIINERFKEGSLSIVDRIHLIGFDDIPPLTHSLLKGACSALTNHFIKTDSPSNINRYEFQTREEEIVAAANWAKHQISQNPEATIGIISPNLGQTREQIEKVFCQVFEPHYNNVSQPRYALPFNFSAGTPLATTPLVCDTLSLLKLTTATLSIDDCLNLLNSPFWSAGYFQEESTLAIKHLLKLEKFDVSFSDLRHAFAEESQIKQTLINFDQYFRRLPKRQKLKVWVKNCVEALELMGWPGQRRLDSLEYQQVVQWQSVLASLVNLDLFDETKTYFQFITELSRAAATTPFQAQTRGTPIQILGALEAAGLQFSGTWVLSLDDQTWPAAPSPNPLLPVDLQRRYNFPNATAERELAYAQSLTQRYLASAETVNISSAKWSNDCELSPSGIISTIPLSELLLVNNTPEINTATDGQVSTDTTNDVQTAFNFDDHSTDNINSDQPSDKNENNQNNEKNKNLTTTQNLITETLLSSYTEQQYQSSKKVWIDCETIPEVQDPSQQKGGTSLLQWQAQQPFNAFAKYRLKLQPIEPASRHLKPTIRGQITHDVLANFWESVKTQENLVKIPNEERREKIAHLVSRVIQSTNHAHRGEPLSPEMQKIEARRQTKIINHWLEYETDRNSFEVEATEFTLSATFSGLNISVRVDRLDKIGDQTLLIDYKSGAVNSTKQWLDARPQQPQLPLYLMLVEPQPTGISFAYVSTKTIGFKGIGNLQSAVDGIAIANGEKLPPWEVLIDQWQENLQTLCTEFIQGINHNHFYHPSAATYQEDYLSFNRINEKHQLYTLWQQNPNCLTVSAITTKTNAQSTPPQHSMQTEHNGSINHGE